MSSRPLVVPRPGRPAPRPVTPVTIARRALAAALLLLPLATTADAQILRVPRRADPSVWLVAGAGFWQSQTVADGRTASAWEFGSALQWRVGLESGRGRGNSIGLTGSYTRAPLRYYSEAGVGGCANGCDATMDVLGAALGFHAGGGEGLHQVLNATAGVIQYRNLRFDSPTQSAGVEPPESDVDPHFTIGYGFGYEFSPRFQVAIVQDFGLSWHQRDNLARNVSNLPQQRVLRFSARLGGGQRRPVR